MPRLAPGFHTARTVGGPVSDARAAASDLDLSPEAKSRYGHLLWAIVQAGRKGDAASVRETAAELPPAVIGEVLRWRKHGWVPIVGYGIPATLTGLVGYGTGGGVGAGLGVGLGLFGVWLFAGGFFREFRLVSEAGGYIEAYAPQVIGRV